jgi:hypothetical protein
MSVNPAAFRALRRITLAFGLCVLAVVFALEAKTAWFGPVNGPGIDVQAAKALPADLPRLFHHGASAANPLPPLLSFALLAALKPERSAHLIGTPREESRTGSASPALAVYLSPPLYFRPPPSPSLRAFAS